MLLVAYLKHGWRFALFRGDLAAMPKKEPGAFVAAVGWALVLALASSNANLVALAVTLALVVLLKTLYGTQVTSAYALLSAAMDTAAIAIAAITNNDPASVKPYLSIWEMLALVRILHLGNTSNNCPISRRK